jgi:hypothetical protein
VRSAVGSSVLDAIGHTPLVELSRITRVNGDGAWRVRGLSDR